MSPAARAIILRAGFGPVDRMLDKREYRAQRATRAAHHRVLRATADPTATIEAITKASDAYGVAFAREQLIGEIRIALLDLAIKLGQQA